MSIARLSPAVLLIRLFAMIGLIVYMPVYAADDLEPVSLKLKWQHQFQFAGYYAAIEKGFYADAGFDVTLIQHQGGQDLFEPIIRGDIEFGLADSSLAVKRLQDSPVVVLTTVFQHSPLVMISLKDSGIRSPLEFTGRKLMFQQGADDASLQAMLATLGVSRDDFELVPHNFDNLALLADEPQVDVMSAYLSNQPFLYQELGFDVQIIDPANYGIDFYGDLLYTSEAYVKNHPDRAIAFRDASLRGWEYALNNPDEVIDWLQERYQSQKTRAALEYEAEVIRQMVSAQYVALGTVYPERFERIASIYKQLKMAPDNGTLDGFLLADYLDNEGLQAQRLLRVIVIVAVVLSLVVGALVLISWSLRRTVKNRTAELDQTNKALSHQLKLTDQYVITAVVDGYGNFTHASTALCNVSGYSHNELLDMRSDQLVSDKMFLERQRVIEQVRNGQSWHGEMEYKRKDGGYFWVYIYIDPMLDESGHVAGYRSTASDITEKKLIERISETDGLTGVANRKKLDDVLQLEWDRHKRYGQPISLMLLDLDFFKKINDEFGHLEGDKVLKKVAFTVQESLRKLDVLGRWGGEEFMIILPQTNLESARQVAEKLRQQLENISDLACSTVTGSFGVASSDGRISELETMIRLADEALYYAKNNGRNRVEVAD